MSDPLTTDPPALVENMLLLRREDFDDLLDRAAERALACLGLESSHAARDVCERRDRLKPRRDTRKTAWQTSSRSRPGYPARLDES